MKMESDKRAQAYFEEGYRLFHDRNDLIGAEQAFLQCIGHMDKCFVSTVYIQLYWVYKSMGDKERMRETLETGIRTANEYSYQEAMRIIRKHPEYKEGILDALETNKPFPTDWKENGVIFRPYDVMMMIGLLDKL